MTNVRHQIKSRFYYLFWGICTVSVVWGQVTVAAGYRQMTESVTQLANQFKNESIERTLPLQIRGGHLEPAY